MAHYMELWDAYDEKLNKIEGMTLVRGEEVPDGVFHLVCEIIVRHTDGTYLLICGSAKSRRLEFWSPVLKQTKRALFLCPCQSQK